jgi:hypothetical protein
VYGVQQIFSKGKNPATDFTDSKDEGMGGSASRCTRDGCVESVESVACFSLFVGRVLALQRTKYQVISDAPHRESQYRFRY